MRRLGKIGRRTWAGVLALILMLSVVLSALTPTRTMAATFTGKNIWTRGAEVMFGKSRNYLYRWTDGYQMTFCIDPGDHMGTEVKAGAKRYHIDDGNIPYIRGREDFERLALICDWFDTQAGSVSASNASYAAAQAAVWAVVTEAWGDVDGIVSQVNRHVSGTLGKWQELKTYMDDTLGGVGSSSLPDWCSTIESSAPFKNMTLKDGKYKIDLDLTGYPELASVPWEFPDGKWSKSVTGNTLSITYNGLDVPWLILKGKAPPSMNLIAKNSQNITIYIPERAKDQAMIGAGLKSADNTIFLKLTGGFLPSSESTTNLEIFEHNETFESHYNIDLTKFDAETNQPLEGSIFEVLEAFDANQLSLVDSTSMSPSPSTWSGFRADGQMMTDASGHASHQDIRYYNYSKTYCSGHPDPQYLDIPDPEPDPDTGDILNAGEIEAAEEENERLRLEWEAIATSCEAQTDFHSITAGEGLEMMLENRDATYEEFIYLNYDYTIREIEARYGYILHGKHNDDETIPIIRIDSSEAGAASSVISRNISKTEDGVPYNTFRKIEPEYASVKTLLPETTIYSLDESRMIAVTEESEEYEDIPEEDDIPEEESKVVPPIATPSDSEEEAELAAGIEVGPKIAQKAAKERLVLKKSMQEVTKDSEVLPEESTEPSTREGVEAPIEESTESSSEETTETPKEENTEDSEQEESEEETTEQETTENTTENTIEDTTEDTTEEPPDEIIGETEPPSKYSYHYTMLERSYGEIPVLQLLDIANTRESHQIQSSSLPSPQEDEVDWITPSGDTSSVAYSFRISNHRTEGEIHMNKRDLELHNQDPAASYGQVQGDATLEGAVYGLYAAQDIIHPDGQTGVVYKQNDLTALATTDQNGDASFMAYTEESSQSETVPNLAGQWIGHPLLLGNYYIKEISRSEGYELSAYGINLEESNRGATEHTDNIAGSVSNSTLWHPIDMHDGSWNEFTVKAQDTINGYDIQITGYPEGAELSLSKLMETTTTEQVVIGTVRKETGEYEKAGLGEKKMDADGNYIPVLDAEGNPLYDSEAPLAETFFTYYRLNTYPSGTAVPGNPELWSGTDSPDLDYIKAETNSMLRQTGLKSLDEDHGDGAPWSIIDLNGSTNQELAESILDWFAENNFWDAGAVHRVYEDGGIYKAEIFHDYKAVIAPSIYDALNGVVYIRKDIIVDGRGTGSHMFFSYPEGEFSISGSYATVSPAKAATGVIPFMDEMTDYVEICYQPLYETYADGEYRLDRYGEKIPVYETEFIYGEEEQTAVDYRLTPVEAAYDREKGIYTIHVENATDWDQTDLSELTYRITTKEKNIIIDGEEMYYNDYLIHVKGAGASACPAVAAADESYIQYQNLAYPGQMQAWQDGHTGTVPVQVLERVIKQSIKVTKDVAQESYNQNNTYQIHKDPFTILFGGYYGKGRKYVSGFHFRAYRLSELEEAADIPLKADGTYDLNRFFQDQDQESVWDDLALEWDRPDKDTDGDLTTLYADEGGGAEAYYGTSVMLPYGTYVVVEQIPVELVNKHYQIDEPRVVILPYVPQVTAGGTVSGHPSSDYLYFAEDTPDELVEKFGIRFHEETHVIQAHNHDGDFEIYKYGLDQEAKPEVYANEVIGRRYRWNSTSEDAGTADGIYYEVRYDEDGDAIDYGVTLDDVKTMTGMTTAIDGKYAPALVPWSVLDERSGAEGNRYPGLESDGSFNFISFLKTHFENTLYSSKLRVEKIDADTGENIIHAGAMFRIYAANRDVTGDGADHVTGTGDVIFRTSAITGTRKELEARGDVDDITWNGTTYEGTVTEPDYSRLELVKMLDETGAEVGIFKAFSTEREIVKPDGTVSKEQVGYIQTYQPLGAGAYVLVEIQAPPGYMKSKPIAFEIYRDQVTYYADGEAGKQVEAKRFQYVIPKADHNQEPAYEDVSQVMVKDKPSKLYIHKVEDGDSIAGDKNALDGLSQVNDSGDLITYMIRGRKEYLEARGDVQNITWDAEEKEYYGTVAKYYQEWSEDLITGTEAQLLAMEGVKLLYDVETGDFSGYGIHFKRSVSGAELVLYKGLEVERIGEHSYRGVTVTWEEGKGKEITASQTGNHLEITTHEQDTAPPYHNIWDAESIGNKPIKVFFYDLKQEKTELDQQTGELWVLDERGNRLCLADAVSGMAYVYDDEGHLIVYEADETGEKILAESAEVHDDGTGRHIYIDLAAKEDEMGLPLYYHDGNITYRQEIWNTDGSPHEIARLPFGAYILEEARVPHEQGYIQSLHLGLILRESSEDQHIYMQNDFTKVNIAKIDITTKKEIRDADMTLYRAVSIEDDSEKGYHLEKRGIYRQWISGYLYDDKGNLRFNQGDEKPVTTQPHWLDHIPPGWYILEETAAPYEWGYIPSEPKEILIRETGDVQTFVMEDDYTVVEIRKTDGKTGEVLEDDRKAVLSLYQPLRDAEGNLVYQSSGERPGQDIIAFDPAAKIVTWETGSGEEVAASGRQVIDEYGESSMVYDYEIHQIGVTAGMLQARYYTTEYGTTRFEYLPVGEYVLVEERTPEGYATAVPQLITVKEAGHQRIQEYEMADMPLKLEVSKTDMPDGIGQVRGGILALYPVIDGQKGEQPLYRWMSRSDGSDEDGRWKPHLIEYIPKGDYVLVEESVPYGFLKAEDLFITVRDTEATQQAEMIDRIPEGILTIIKHDMDDEGTVLNDAVFSLTNQDTGQRIEILTTGDDGSAKARPVPAGYLDRDGEYVAYTYVVEEVTAPEDYMLNAGRYEFQFTYVDAETPVLTLTYDAMNRQNQVRFKKQDDGGDHLAGARLRVIQKGTGALIEEWVSNGQDHYITGIKSGDYTLIEVETPGDGYALATDIDFTVGRNMTEPVYVKMTDPSSRVDIGKVISGTETLLEGAKLQLLTQDGTVIREWTSNGHKPETFYGLTPGSYIIKELSAPPGYRKDGDMIITVEDTSDTQIFYLENKKQSDGGGQIHPPKNYISFKKEGADGAFLEGAEFTFYRADGSVYEAGITDSGGIIRLLQPPEGTYTFKETKAPEGYYISNRIYSFTVTEEDVVTGEYKIVDLPHSVVEITKKSVQTGEALEGAVFSVSKDGVLIHEGQTDVAGIMKFPAAEPGTYQIKEVKPPEGYQSSPLTFEIIVHEDGTVSGNTVIYNSNDSEKQKIGRVVAHYKTSRSGAGSGSFNIPGRIVPGAKTGDDTPMIAYAVVLFISLCGVGGTWKKMRKTGKKKKGHMLMVLFLLTAGLSFSDDRTVRAAEAVAEGEVLTVRSEPFIKEEDKPTPEECYEYQGKRYRLKNWSVLETELPARTETAEDRIIYEEVEQADRIPEVITMEVLDEVSGQKTPMTVPLKDYEYQDYRWVDNFSFNILVESADAKYYALGDILIDSQEEHPFTGYEKELLELIGVSQEAYRIHQVEWLSEPWQGEDGLIYRQAVARGSKQVATVEARYSGLVELGPIPASLIESVYQTEVTEETDQTDQTDQEVIVQKEEEEVEKVSIWKQLLNHVYVKMISVSVLFILLCLLFLYLIRKRKERNE